jgi:hypothetical protein
LTDAEKAKYADVNLYEITFLNKGGLVMPIIVEFTFADGTKEVQKLSAQIWRKNESKVTRVFLTNKKAVSILLDPMRETADIDESNNRWPNVSAPSKFALLKQEVLVEVNLLDCHQCKVLKTKSNKIVLAIKKPPRKTGRFFYSLYFEFIKCGLQLCNLSIFQSHLAYPLVHHFQKQFFRR